MIINISSDREYGDSNICIDTYVYMYVFRRNYNKICSEVFFKHVTLLCYFKICQRLVLLLLLLLQSTMLSISHQVRSFDNLVDLSLRGCAPK